MDTSNEIKLLKAKVALLETEKKHLIQKLAGLEKKKSEAPRNILPFTIISDFDIVSPDAGDIAVIFNGGTSILSLIKFPPCPFRTTLKILLD